MMFTWYTSRYHVTIGNGSPHVKRSTDFGVVTKYKKWLSQKKAADRGENCLENTIFRTYLYHQYNITLIGRCMGTEQGNQTSKFRTYITNYANTILNLSVIKRTTGQLHFICILKPLSNCSLYAPRAMMHNLEQPCCLISILIFFVFICYYLV